MTKEMIIKIDKNNKVKVAKLYLVGKDFLDISNNTAKVELEDKKNYTLVSVIEGDVGAKMAVEGKINDKVVVKVSTDELRIPPGYIDKAVTSRIKASKF